MKRMYVVVVLLAILAGRSLPASATSNLELGPAGGLSFNSAGTPFVGWGIKVTGLDYGYQYLPVNGYLSFRTGKLISSKGNQWTFGGGGTFAITGCMDGDLDHDKWCDKKDYSGTLLSGTFLHGMLAGGRNGSKTFRAYFLDEINPRLAQSLGTTGTLSRGMLNINFTGNGMSSAYSVHPTRILSAYMKAPALPEPSSLPLFGSGFVAIGLLCLRKLRPSTS
jgi:hypothetical protein